MLMFQEDFEPVAPTIAAISAIVNEAPVVRVIPASAANGWVPQLAIDIDEGSLHGPEAERYFALASLIQNCPQLSHSTVHFN